MLDRCGQKVSGVILRKDRDPRFVTIRRGGTLTDSDHQLLALWAASCAEHVMLPCRKEWATARGASSACGSAISSRRRFASSSSAGQRSRTRHLLVNV
jgi:hypothetical protein